MEGGGGSWPGMVVWSWLCMYLCVYAIIHCTFICNKYEWVTPRYLNGLSSVNERTGKKLAMSSVEEGELAAQSVEERELAA